MDALNKALEEATEGPWMIAEDLRSKWIPPDTIAILEHSPDTRLTIRATLVEHVEADSYVTNARLIVAAVNNIKATTEALEKALALLDRQRAEYNAAPSLLPRPAVVEGPIAKEARTALAALARDLEATR